MYAKPGTLTVYAGFALPIPADGIVLGGAFVVTNTLDRMTPVLSPVYWMPAQVGGVEIVQADGVRLTLRADDGSHWIFDVATRTWDRAPAAGAATNRWLCSSCRMCNREREGSATLRDARVL
jgi:hypothetical protein